MRGTDPTKSKWECPTMFYVCFRRKSPTNVSLNKKLALIANICLFVIVDSTAIKLAIFYLIYV